MVQFTNTQNWWLCVNIFFGEAEERIIFFKKKSDDNNDKREWIVYIVLKMSLAGLLLHTLSNFFLCMILAVQLFFLSFFSFCNKLMYMIIVPTWESAAKENFYFFHIYLYARRSDFIFFRTLLPHFLLSIFLFFPHSPFIHPPSLVFPFWCFILFFFSILVGRSVYNTFVLCMWSGSCLQNRVILLRLFFLGKYKTSFDGKTIRWWLLVFH